MIPHVDEIVRSCVSMAQQRVKFVHNGRSRAGVDCSGLILVALWENGVKIEDHPTPYTRMEAISGALLAACRCHFDEIDPADSGHGDMMMMWWDRGSKIPQHLVIRNGEDRIVHAYQGCDHVADVTLARRYRHRVTHAFRFPARMVRR